MNRKDFLVGCSAGLALFATTRMRLLAAPLLHSSDQDHVFIVLFLRGGCDGLHLVGPTASAMYQDARPAHLKVAASGRNQGHALSNAMADLDFRLHHEAGGLHDLYTEGDLAILHACGLQNGTRSHFVAMDLIERGLQRKAGAQGGWMSRYFSDARAYDGVLPAVCTSGAMPQAMADFGRSVSIRDLENFDLIDFVRKPELLRKWYGEGDLLGKTAQTTLNTISQIKAEVARNGDPGKGRGYPTDGPGEELGKALRTMARLIKMNVGMRVGQVDFGGWDTHEHQQFHFPQRVKALSRAVTAFYEDIAGHRDQVTVLVMSEFGRRLRANRSDGTDHGYGNMMMVLGGKVKGGRMYGDWPGLAPENLDKGVDLAITTDYRSVIGEILMRRMGLEQLDSVFPGFDRYAAKGFLAD
ncbi:MAG: DUF1501 domain-containing protein [Bacteroidota bacterium]